MNVVQFSRHNKVSWLPNKVAVSEGAAGSPPFYGERVTGLKDAVT